MSNNYSQAEDLAFPVAFVAVATNATMCKLAVADIMREEEAGDDGYKCCCRFKVCTRGLEFC